MDQKKRIVAQLRIPSHPNTAVRFFQFIGTTVSSR
jgi:hypothetical protein